MNSLITMIIRTVHNRDNPYFMIRRATAQDEQLPAKALGVLVYLLSKPDTWEPTIPDICARFSDVGRDLAYKIINEIFIPLRYARRVQERGSVGQITKWVTEIFEEPLPEMPEVARPGKQKAPVPETQDVVNPENQDAPVPEPAEVGVRPVPDSPVPERPVPEIQEHRKYRVPTENTEKEEITEHQQSAANEKDAAAASRFNLATVKAYVQSTKPHAQNPGGLARALWRSGEEDSEIEKWAATLRRKVEDLNATPFDAFAQQQAEFEAQRQETEWLKSLPAETYEQFFTNAANDFKRRFPDYARHNNWQQTHKGAIEKLIITGYYQEKAA